MDGRQSAMLLMVALAVVAVFLFRYTQRLAIRLAISGAIGIIAALAGYSGMMGYAIPAVSDINSPGVKLRTAILGSLLIWAVCVASLVLAVRFLLYAVRPRKSRLNGPAKS